MKNIIKKVMSVIAAAAVIMSVGITSLAADYEITINRPNEDKAEHTYSAYQIFSGTVIEDTSTTPATKILKNLEWGDGINETALLADTDLAASVFSSCTSAGDFAAKIEENPASNSLAFEQLVSKHLTTASGTVTTSDNPAILSVPEQGYYFIKDQVAGDVNGAASKFMLKVVDIHTAVALDAKEVMPSIDKVINQDGGIKANNAAIGDEIPFLISSTVPDLKNKGYNNYWFVITDTLCKGLTYNNNIKVKIKDTELDPEDYELTVSKDTAKEVTVIELAIKDFLSYGLDDEYIGEPIEVSYTATLNKDCDITSAGNPNTAQLSFSNDPSQDYSGSDKPTSTSTAPVGKTPEVMTKTYTTGITVIKIDDSGNRLTGAEFSVEITGTSKNKVVVEREVYTSSETGTYYKLKNGTYTETAPTNETSSSYDSTDTKYTLEKVRSVQSGTGATVTVTASVDDQGRIVFAGLGEGTYTIREAMAPTGYVKSTTEHKVVISAGTPTLTDPDWDITVDNTQISSADAIELTITNIKSNDLPETGGSGTTIFYVAGSVLLLAGAALFVTKKVILKNGNK